MKRSRCMPAVRFCCPAYAGRIVDDQKPDSDVLQSVSSGVCTDVVFNSSPKTFGWKEQRDFVGSEARNAERIPAIEMTTELDESAEVACLRNFTRTLEGGPSEFGAEVDDNDIRSFLHENTDAEDELDVKIYKNQDPLSPDHLALHLPKCKGCSGCDMGKSFKSHSRRRKQPKVFVSLLDATAQPFGAMAHLDTIAMEPNS